MVVMLRRDFEGVSITLGVRSFYSYRVDKGISLRWEATFMSRLDFNGDRKKISVYRYIINII